MTLAKTENSIAAKYLVYTPEQIEEISKTQTKEGPIRCTECKKSLGRARNFRIISREYSPPVRSPVCLACEAKVEARALTAAIAERAVMVGIDDETRRQIKQAKKKKASVRTTQYKQRQEYKKRLKKAEKVLKPQSDAEVELLQRELAARDLLHYIERSMPHYKAGWVHEDICRRLEKFVRDVENQLSPRLMLWMPPRHGKSEIASVRFPEWVLGRHPEWEFIATSYALDLPLGFSRRIRSRIPEADYKAIFPRTALSKDATSAESWRTTAGGGYRAAGVGGGITGMGAHILLIDDPVKDQEEADSETIRQKVWDWFGTTAYTRLAPGGGILVIQCMTGDTPVLRPDGSEIRLDELCTGDEVATYNDGRLSTSKVMNHTSQGRDRIFTITTSSGKMVRANERHPFLVAEQGGLRWTRLRDLRTGHRIVALKDSGGSGKVRHASGRAATNQPFVADTANPTTTKSAGRTDTVPHQPMLSRVATHISNTATEYLSKSTTAFLKLRAVFARYASSLRAKMSALIGAGSFASITATTPTGCAGFSVMTATSQLDMPRLQTLLSPLPDISDFTTEEIIAIEPAGVEEVFDVEVERTENFIANGLVSHNTRWHDDDLSGRLQEQMNEVKKDIAALRDEIRERERTMSTRTEQLTVEGLKQQLEELHKTYDNWEIVSYPAMAEHNEYFEKRSGAIKREGYDFVEGARYGDLRKLRAKGDPLHPMRFNREMLLKIKRTLQPRHWSALYQQNPVPDEGLFFTKDMLRYELHVPDYREMYTFVAWDLAVGQKQTNDWTVGVVGALDWNDDIHIIDLVRARWNTHQIAEAIVSTHVKYESILTGIEKGQLELAIKPSLEKVMQERRQYITLAEGDQALKPITDKMVRARPLQGRMQQGKLILPSDQPWVEVLVHELLRFPGGLHDDIVDSLAWLVKMILGHAPPAKPSSVAQFTSWKEKLAEFTDGGRRKHWMAA